MLEKVQVSSGLTTPQVFVRNLLSRLISIWLQARWKLPWVDDLIRENDGGSMTLWILHDLLVTFDTTDYSSLLEHLSGLHVGRTCFTVVSLIPFRQVSQGGAGRLLTAPHFDSWPQGSVLSSMLFNIYVKMLGEITKRLGLWHG